MREIADTGAIKAWLSNEENLKKYREWRDDPTTSVIISLLLREAAPIRIPSDASGRVQVELAGYFHGQNVGEHRVLRRMTTLDTVTEIPEQMLSDYNLKQNLIDEGRTPEEADRIIKEQSNA